MVNNKLILSFLLIASLMLAACSSGPSMPPTSTPSVEETTAESSPSSELDALEEDINSLDVESDFPDLNLDEFETSE